MSEVFDKTNLLITGASGFIGRNLTDYFTENPTYQVWAPSHSILDLLNETAVEEFIKNKKITLIIHCANIGGSKNSITAVNVLQNNLRMFFNLERCLTPEMKMFHMGSGAEYDCRHYQPKMKEDFFDRFVPKDEYGYSKYLIAKHVQQSGNITGLRIFGLYGKYEDYRFRFISNAIVKNILRLPIIINRNVVFDYLYINDFVRIMEEIILIQPKVKIFNVTPSQSVDLITIAKIINQVGNFQSEIQVLHEGMNKEYTGNNSLLLQEIGPFRFIAYEEGIKNLYQHYKNNLNQLDVEAVRDDKYLRFCQTSKEN